MKTGFSESLYFSKSIKSIIFTGMLLNLAINYNVFAQYTVVADESDSTYDMMSVFTGTRVNVSSRRRLLYNYNKPLAPSTSCMSNWCSEYSYNVFNQ